MTFSRLVTALTLCICACSFKGASSPELASSTSDAPFVFLPATVTAVELVASDADFGLTNHKIYHLQACAQDRATSQRLIGTIFTLEKNGHPPQILKPADGAGCVRWSESVQFRPLVKKQVFVEMPRFLSTAGVRVPVPLVNNPWLEGAPGMLDLQSAHALNPVPENEAATALFAEPTTGTFVEQISLTPTEQIGNHFSYSFLGRIKGQRTLENGSTQEVILPRGSFTARLFVVEIPQGEQPHLIGQSGAFPISVEQSLFRGLGEIKYSQDPDGRSPTFLYYELQPFSTEAGVTSVQGARAFPALREGTSGVPEQVGALVDQMKLAASGVKRVSEQSANQKIFVVDGSHGKFDSSTPPDPATSKIRARFTAQVHVVDPKAPTKPIAFFPFEYLVSDDTLWPAGTKGTMAESNSRGEVKVTGEVEYLELAKSPQVYLKKHLLIRSKHPTYAGVTRSTTIWINPWQRGPLFYRDIHNEGAPSYTAPEEDKAALVLTEYSADFLGRKFEVNKFLNLTTLREWSFTFKPQLVRANPEGNGDPLNLTKGTRFKMTVVLADPAASPKEPLEGFLSAYEAEVKVNASQKINTQVILPIDFTEQARLDSRGRVYITLTPLSSEAGLVEPVILSANMVSNPNGNDNSTGKEIQFDKALTGTLPRIPKEKTRAIVLGLGTGYVLETPLTATESPVELLKTYLSNEGPLKFYAQEQIRKEELPGEETLQDLFFSSAPATLEQSKALLTVFCSRSDEYLSKTDRGLCKKNPENYFQLSRITLVEKVLHSHDTLAVESTNNSYTALSASFFKEHQYTSRLVSADKSSEHFVEGVNSKVGVGLLGNEATAGTAFNHEREWYDLVEFASGDSERSRYSRTDTITLSKEEITLPLDLEIRYCMVIRPQRFALAISQSLKKPLNTHLFCSAPVEKKGIRESWYSIRDRWNAVHSAGSDPKHPAERGWYKLIRGPQAFGNFERLISNKVREFYFKKVDPFIDGVDSFLQSAFTAAQRARLLREGGVFPGALTLEDTVPSRWTAFQIHRYARKVAQGAGEDAVVRKQAEEFGWCYYEHASRNWDHADYIKQSARKDLISARQTPNDILNSQGVRDYCHRYARREEVK